MSLQFENKRMRLLTRVYGIYVRKPMSCHKEGAVSSLSHLYILVTLYVVSFPGSLQAVGSWVGPGNEAKQYQVYHILVTLYDGISGKIILVILIHFNLLDSLPWSFTLT